MPWGHGPAAAKLSPKPENRDIRNGARQSAKISSLRESPHRCTVAPERGHHRTPSLSKRARKDVLRRRAGLPQREHLRLRAQRQRRHRGSPSACATRTDPVPPGDNARLQQRALGDARAAFVN